ncbi:hypothetical protein [Hymenobacter antarcticus]|uniref:Por secretion system C-terminal sorting domain-containing protein n=1 Tax=Hymenobacter antarcticus TaxID=486270 RepID=A0ABP7QQD0_9BACT
MTDNYFAKCTRAVVITGQQYAPFAPAISCNTIESCDQGIAVESSATVGQLSGPPGGPGPFGVEPVANKYAGLNVDVQNDGQYSPLSYIALSSPSESPTVSSSLGRLVTINFAPGTPCNQRPSYGLGVNGLYRPSANSNPKWQDWENAIQQPNGGERDLHELELKLIDYREHAGQLAQLEIYANTLPLINDVAFERMSIYLMEKYRHLGRETDVNRVRQNLLSQRSQNVEVQRRVSCFDVMGRSVRLVPGATPTTADSTALVEVAGSSSGFAPVACEILRYFYPRTLCGISVVSGKPVQRDARTPEAGERAVSTQIRAYPNPGSDKVTIQVTGSRDGTSVFQLVELRTGHIVLTQALVDERMPIISVEKMAPGVYVGRLVGEAGHLLCTCKIVVVH